MKRRSKGALGISVITALLLSISGADARPRVLGDINPRMLEAWCRDSGGEFYETDEGVYVCCLRNGGVIYCAPGDPCIELPPPSRPRTQTQVPNGGVLSQ